MFKTYLSVPLITVLFLGFASGLPLALTGATLTAWLAQSHVDIKTIGLFAAVAMPYSLKFLWSPVIDSIPVPKVSKLLGRRRGWMITIQVALMLAVATQALASPAIDPFVAALAAMLVAFLSASQDIVIDAYRVEILKPEEQGEGAAMTQIGYRLGMIVSGAGALCLAQYTNWQVTYLVMSCTMLVGIVTTLLAKEPEFLLEGGEHSLPPSLTLTPSEGVVGCASSAYPRDSRLATLPSFRESVIDPFVNFTKNESWWLILIFIVVYKLADAFIGIVTNPFLLDIGFQLGQIAYIFKIYGVIATLCGTFCGGYLVMRYGTIRIMFVAGFLHAATNLLYVLQARIGADVNVLALSVTVENITNGISSAGFVAYLSGLCNRHYTATQYALLSSLASLGRTLFATRAGYAVKYLGWEWFFALSALLALPGLGVLYVLNKRIKK